MNFSNLRLRLSPNHRLGIFPELSQPAHPRLVVVKLAQSNEANRAFALDDSHDGAEACRLLKPTGCKIPDHLDSIVDTCANGARWLGGGKYRGSRSYAGGVGTGLRCRRDSQVTNS